MSIFRYYQQSKEIVQNIKLLAKQNKNYRDSWKAIDEFIEEDALAAFIAGLSDPYFGYAQAARPTDIEDAYAFLCKFKAKQKTAHNMTSSNNNNGNNHYNNKNGGPSKYPGPTKQDRTTFKNANRKTDSFLEKKPTVEPMEVDPSFRSRLTHNKKNSSIIMKPALITKGKTTTSRRTKKKTFL